MLDQAWSSSPINTQSYFRSWVTNRYSSGPSSIIPAELYTAWEILRTTGTFISIQHYLLPVANIDFAVYNNTNVTANAVPKAIYELGPNISGLTNRTGHHPYVQGFPTVQLSLTFFKNYTEL
jgi:alpha-N-acetylglucosaminidase